MPDMSTDAPQRTSSMAVNDARTLGTRAAEKTALERVAQSTSTGLRPRRSASRAQSTGAAAVSRLGSASIWPTAASSRPQYCARNSDRNRP